MALMDCSECGHKISSQASACPACGHPVVPNRFLPYAAPASRSRSSEPPSDALSLAAMLCGVGGLVMLFLPCAWLLAGLPNVLGMLLGGLAMGKVRRGEAVGWGMAVIGLVTGIIGLLLSAGMWFMWQDAVQEAFSE